MQTLAGMHVIRILLSLAIVSVPISTWALGNHSDCRRYLESHIALSVQKGSLEDAYPGLVEELMRIHDEMMQQTIDFQQVIAQLYTLKMQIPEPAFYSVVDELDYKATYMLPEFFPRLASHVWEAVVASLFSGHQIHFNKMVSEIHPDAFLNATRGLTAEQAHEFDREIDIAVETSPGKWVWLEVKNWTSRHMDNKYYREKLLTQSLVTNATRKKLNLDISYQLVTKWRPSQSFYEFVFRRTAFTKIRFVIKPH